ncbi:MAG: HNH endonuclease [Planctomycetes bacterium]|nr:HNH endonuclease [Planctomycetota bacterium]MBI3848278.1 HNH endonuclease [Planctomycetota bacterium]
MSALNDATLVLNRSWVAIHVTSVRTALSLVYQGCARIISPETYETHDFASWTDLSVANGDRCIRTVSLTIRVPEIIVLLAYDGIPKKEVPFSRKNIYKRDTYTCQYCGRRASSEDLSIDHIIPRSHGGRSSWTNCVLACIRCNVRKGNRTLREAGMTLLHKPQKPDWSPALTLTFGAKKESWEKFISDRYWNIELSE